MERAHPIEKLDTRQHIELAEGVEVSLVVAGPYPRCAAFLIDLVIRGLLLSAIGVVLFFTMGEESYLTNAGLMLLVLFFISWFYHVIFEAGRKGATPGKRYMGLKVVQPSGAPITYGQSFVRNLMRFADIMPGFCYAVGLLTIFLTKRCQRLGDLVADTLVVYQKPQDIMMGDMQKSGQASQRPAHALTRDEEEALVAFCDRVNTWSTARQVELADQLQILTGKTGVHGVRELEAIGQWVRNER